MSKSKTNQVDLFIIGGGINGCGIARDAVGRGLSVTLAEMSDIGGATSSSSLPAWDNIERVCNHIHE